MCGIAGFIDARARLDDPDGILTAMAASLHHRGPDDSGIWFERDSGVGLAHARLSIIDLSSEGHQPMVSSSGRTVIVYNGEIYNFPELRKELEGAGCRFRGYSDTEVLLEGIEHFGLERMVSRCIGMFAFAVWDVGSRTLHLVRDRIGIKPLFYSIGSHGLVFGSELKALFASRMLDPTIDPSSVASFLRFAYVPATASILSGVRKLAPGTIASFSDSVDGIREESTRYWCAVETARAAAADPIVADRGEAIDMVEDMLRRATVDRMVADVPLGAFLSGGIDSSLIVSLMQEASSTPVRTFTIGFEESAYDESVNARAVAKHLGTDHTELIVTPEESLAVIPDIPGLYDEPFADPSQIPTFIVSRLARTDVTVSLSGDGGDELFGGYNRYAEGLKVWQKISTMPGPVRGFLQGVIGILSPSGWDNLYGGLRSVSSSRFGPQPFGDRMHKLAAMTAVRSEEDFYRLAVSSWLDPSKLTSAEETSTALDRLDSGSFTSFSDYMMLADTCTYLVDDILTKVDRASMANSLEARVPILDHRVFELAWRLPPALRIEGMKGKIALREVLARHVPRHLFERPKMGFAVPLNDWLKGPLRDWAESLLHPQSLREIGLDPGAVGKTWSEHLAGRYNRQAQIWPVLMLRAWSERWRVTVRS